MKKVLGTIILFGFLVGCAGVPVRPALQENLDIPPGNVEGNRFTGIRYPFHVSVPSHWKMTTEFPEFLEELGFIRPLPTDKERTELYAYNPRTKSNIHFDFTPAGPHATFSQEKIQLLTTVATDSLRSELDEKHGKNAIPVEIGPTQPASLKGVQFAARKHVTYALEGRNWEQGWIYGFTEPYQVFILYLILDQAGSNDREDTRKILDSFGFRTGE
ncbi:MAG: hypothetical protein WBG20_02665 [Candidatus Deferrimicrobiaceae bacterium]